MIKSVRNVTKKVLVRLIFVIVAGFIILLIAFSKKVPPFSHWSDRIAYLNIHNKSECTRLLPLHIHSPGTMMGDVAPFDSSQSCLPCHEEIYKDWSGSPHAHQARMPTHIALRAAVVKYDILRGDWCGRCHEPVAWYEGRAQPNGEEYTRKDYFDLNCDFCHRMVDAVYPDSTALICPQYGPARGYGNAQAAVQTHPDVKRGPRGDTTWAHGVMRDPFQRRSELCGVCHDASNPFAYDPMLARDTAAPHTYGPAQRTYSEWLLSWYATQGEQGTCQACHMPRLPGFSSTTTYRPDVAKHDLTGGNIFILDILPLFPEYLPDLDTVELRKGKERNLAILKDAALLDVTAGRERDSVTVIVRVTNITGHKLPTGVSARRMWVNLVGYDENGDTVFESGKYDFQNARIVSDPQLKLYIFRPGMTERTAAMFGLQAGPSGLAGINDTIYYDNRIPPRGYEYAKFKERMAEPVGYHYPDGQYWDDTRYRLPKNVTRVKATLYYLSITRATIEWLRNENINNEFDRYNMGQRLYDAYFASGKAPPIVMKEATVDVKDTLTSLENVVDKPIQVKFNLAQNFPNPFNASTRIDFWVSDLSDVKLEVYDLLGTKILTLVNERMQGERSVNFDASSTIGRLSTGVYFYKLSVNNQSKTKKFILIK